MNKNKRDKILIVDDEEAVRELLALNLSDLYDADTADSVKEAVKKIELSKYALVITDMKMPGGNGLDLIKLIKEKSPETIVIAITGFSSVEDAISALKLGAEEYVLKPLDFDKFNVIVKSLIEKYRLRKKLSIIRRSFVHEKLMGVLNLNMLDEGKVFSDEDLDILSMFSLSLALSMENAMFKNELIESNERLKEIDKLKTELISNVSHELRTPLTAMKGSLDLMLFHSAEPTE